MVPESKQHKMIKEILELKLHEWFGASLKEYPSSGHELDVFSVPASGIFIYVEVVWNNSWSLFLSDMNMLQQSDANVKVVIGSPRVIANKRILREFVKIVLSQRKTGKQIHGEMIDGNRVLEDAKYVENDLRVLFNNLVSQARSQTNELLTKSAWNPAPKLEFSPLQDSGTGKWQFPQVGFYWRNWSPYKLAIRFEVSSILNGRIL